MPSSNIVQDGGFEANTNARTNPNWTSTSTAFGGSLCNTAACGAFARTGNGFVWFDGAASGVSAETGTAAQTVTIPVGATATLSYFVRVAAVTAPSNSFMTVTVDGAVVYTVSEPAVAEAGYSQVIVDLSAFANGSPRVLRFNYSRPAGTSGSDSFMVDDVTLATSCVTTSVTVGGRVTTPTGLSLRNVVVSFIDSQNVRRTASTSSFGIYSFDNVRTNETYIITVTSKRYRFTPQILQFVSNRNDVNFVGLE